MRILVTGGAGFIGSALVRRLVNDSDHHVHVLDKLTYASTLTSLESVSASPRYGFTRADICDAAAVKTVIDAVDPDVIVEQDGRLVIPIFDNHGNMVAAQGRALSIASDRNARKTARYITLKGDKTIEKLWYGMERLDKDGLVYVFEGPLDSLFIPNAVAMIGINDGSNIPKPLKGRRLVFALDNEPRNLAVVLQLKKHIDLGHEVVVWDSSVKAKDINDMVMEGMEVSSIMSMMKKCTCKGAEAILRFNQWKKVTI
jgi:hypothetical protein